MLTQIGKYKEAIEQFNKAEMGLNDDKFYFCKARTLSQMENFPEAVKYINKAIEINPNDPEYYVLKITCLTFMQKHHQATRCYKDGLKVNRFFFAKYPEMDSIFNV